MIENKEELNEKIIEESCRICLELIDRIDEDEDEKLISFMINTLCCALVMIIIREIDKEDHKEALQSISKLLDSNLEFNKQRLEQNE